MTLKLIRPTLSETLLPFAMVIVGGIAVLAFGAWLKNIQPPPDKRVFIPREWSCRSKYEGGYCERTGGYGPKGPWGTAKAPDK